jgi:hypothetical protein
MATTCLKKVHDSQGYNIDESQALRLNALAEAGRGLVELAKELREGA